MRNLLIRSFVNFSMGVAIGGAITTAVLFLLGAEGEFTGRVFVVTLFAFIAGTFPLSTLD